MTDHEKLAELQSRRMEWVASTRTNGFQDGINDLLAHQYSEKTHFIFELLQNAEDAEATEVKFTLHPERLEFSHNGRRLFQFENVESITSIGRSTKDHTKIGKHGIGFKAVFAITHLPRVYSGKFHFEIEDVVVPKATKDSPPDLAPDETRFILPFDQDGVGGAQRFRKLVRPDLAREMIEAALRKLPARTLLFLRNIQTIDIVLAGQSPWFLKRSIIGQSDCHPMIRVESDDMAENWLLFEQPVELSDEGENFKGSVQVAFLVEEGKVRRAGDSRLVVFFPTDKETKLGFLINGPFKTTKARDNIVDCEANKQLIRDVATLASESLDPLRDGGHLDLKSYDALPLRPGDFLPGTIFRPLYDEIRKALSAKALLPRNRGGFVCVNEARLARGKDLAETFSDDQLAKWIGVQKCAWLDTGITSDRMPDLYAYLCGRKESAWSSKWVFEPLNDNLELDAENFAKLNQAGQVSFFEEQTLAWLLRFYGFLVNGPYRAFANTPFIRLDNGTHVSPGAPGKPPNAYLRPDNAAEIDPQDFPLIHEDVVNESTATLFTEKVKLRQPAIVDIVQNVILRRYQSGNLSQVPENYLQDLSTIIQAIETASDVEKRSLVDRVTNCPFLAAYSVGDVNHNALLWKKPGEQGLLAETPIFKMWFHDYNGNDAFFFHSEMATLLESLSKHLRITSMSVIIGCDPSRRGTVMYLQNWGDNAQGLNGFDPRADVLALAHALNHITVDRAKYLWSLLLGIPQLIKGEVQKSSRVKDLELPNRLAKEPKYSKIGASLFSKAWIPSADGSSFHVPNELELSALPEGFQKEGVEAEKVARALGIKVTHDIEALARGYGKSPKEIEFALSLTPEEMRKLETDRRARHPFPAGSSASPQRLARIKEAARQAPLRSYEERTRSVPVGRQEDKNQAREYLEAEYKSGDELCCQLSHGCMPFKLLSSDDWYYEAVECVPDTKRVYRENFLALSPHFAAMFQHANRDRDEMRRIIGESLTNDVKLTLDGKPQVLRFTAKHMSDLKAVLEVDAEPAQPE
jgi:hypothetical protein